MSRKRILVVDDEEILTRLLKISLERTGRFEVRTENSPLSAPGAISEFQPDLVVLDIIMPELNGMALAEQIRSNPATRAIPIIFLSGCAPGAAPGFRQLPKPVTVETIVQAIEEELSGS